MTTENGASHAELLKGALREIRQLRARLEKAEQRTADPIAVVGMGCRFPSGANTPDSYWELLCNGVDATSDIPGERWDVSAYYDPEPKTAGKMVNRRGGFIAHPDLFDARFFHLAGREIETLDPQQRLFLEVAWEALENAAIAPDRLSGTRTGVFVGISGSDYFVKLAQSAPLAELDAHMLTGGALNFAAGRLAFFLGLEGPSLAVDTACSSSLVALHLACRSLRDRECDLAVVGGVNMLLSPDPFVLLSGMGALSPDGRCKAFSASADGYGRGEGCGVVVLRRLADARAASERIVAVIRGSAVNQDGAKSGITVPRGKSQQRVVEAALAAAGIAPAEVAYVETHGTGTSLGDPIEARALAAALGPGRQSERPVRIGSAKSNIAHLESAAGIAGFIKAALCVSHGVIPPHLHCEELSPHINWRELPLDVVTRAMPWPAGYERRIAGVSSFGASGTNAHVVLESAPAEEPPAAATAGSTDGHWLLCLSAKSERALHELAGRYADYLDAHPDANLTDLCYTAATGRAHFAERLAMVADSARSLSDRLREVAQGVNTGATARGRADRDEVPRIAFLFSGQGSQYPGMGRELFEAEPVFRQALQECEQLLAPHLDRPLLSVIYPQPGDESLLDRTEYTQPALFALEWALCRLWRSWGIEPALAIGHSVGEYAAACTAGVFELEHALRLIAARGRAMGALPEGGAMAAIFAGQERVAKALEAQAESVCIAALNSPASTVISGERSAVAAVIDALAKDGIESRWLNVSHAFHSPLLDAALDTIERAAADIPLRAPHLPLIANLHGRIAGKELTQATYWRCQAREPVQFAASVATAHAEGCDIFLEIGPKPGLVRMAAECLPADAAVLLPSLHAGRSDRGALLSSLAHLYVRGAAIDWSGVYRGRACRKLTLPVYPFQRQRYWFHASSAAPDAGRASTGLLGVGGLLGRPLSSPALSSIVHESVISADASPVLREHTVYGHIVVTGAVHLGLVQRALRQSRNATGAMILEQVRFVHPLILPEGAEQIVQAILDPKEDSRLSFRLVSRPAAREHHAGTPGNAHDRDQPAWIEHTIGQIRPLAPGEAAHEQNPPDRLDIEDIRRRCRDVVDGHEFYRRMWDPDEHGLGPNFRLIDRIERRDGEVLARLKPPPLLAQAQALSGEARDFLHDICIGEIFGQVLLPAIPSYERYIADNAHTLVGWGGERMSVSGRGLRASVYAHARLHSATPEEVVGDVCLLDASGVVVAAIEQMALRAIPASLVRRALSAPVHHGRGTAVDLSELLGCDPEERRRRVAEHLCRRIAEISQVEVSSINLMDSLGELGLDSVMVAEMRSWITRELRVEIPLSMLLSSPQILAVSERVCASLPRPD